jgi:hypothetical protein
MNHFKQNTSEQDSLQKGFFFEEVVELMGLEVSPAMIEKAILWHLQRLKPSTRVQIVSDYLSFHSAVLEAKEKDE